MTEDGGENLHIEQSLAWHVLGGLAMIGGVTLIAIF